MREYDLNRLTWILCFVILSLFLPSVLAGPVDVNILRFVTNSPGGTGTSTTYDFNSGFLSYFRDGNLQVDFNVSMSHPQGAHNILLDFNLTNRGVVGGGDVNYVIWRDVNLASTTLPGQGGNLCDSNNFTSSVACRLDLNIHNLVIDRDGNFFVLIKVYDVNTAGQKPTAPNSDTNFSPTFGIDNTAPSLTWDGNHNTWQAFDANVHVTCTDYNSTGGDANNSGCGPVTQRVDTNRASGVTMPAFSVYDTNVLIGPAGDGNYAFDWNATDRAGNRALSSTVVSDTTDYNRTYVLVDKTIPTLTISNAGGNGGSTTVKSTSFVLTYTSGDGNGSGVDKYWVSTDNITWTDNGTNTSYTHTLGAGAPLPVTVTLYLIGNDGVDKNSSTASYTVTFEGGGGAAPAGGEQCGNGVCGAGETTSNCPTDCKAVCGDKVCTGNESIATCPQDCVEGCGNTVCELNESCAICPIDCGICEFTETETLTEKHFDEQPTIEALSDILQEAGFSQSEIDNAVQFLTEVNVSREIIVEKNTTSEGWNEYKTKIELSFQNKGTNELKNVKIVEKVPKELAVSSSQIVSDLPLVVLEEDPIVQFEIPTIKPNSTSIISYSITSPTEIEEETFGLFLPPVVLSAKLEPILPQVGCITDFECNDNNLCTLDRCLQGKCAFAPAEDGTICGFNKECSNGVCIESVTSATPQKQEQQNNLLLVVIFVIAIVALSIYAFSKTRKK